VSLPPWHLWGGSEVIQTSVSAPDTAGAGASGQLARIHYKRPETWHWLFGAQLLEADDASAGQTLDLQIVFELTMGVGRAIFQHRAFDSWNISWVASAAPIGRILMATQTQGFDLARTIVTPPSPPNFIDQIVAEDIQLQVRANLLMSGSIVGTRNAKVQVTAFFSPKSHVRPDWLRADPRLNNQRFKGGEIEGT
jgi:hypothetical protein